MSAALNATRPESAPAKATEHAREVSKHAREVRVRRGNGKGERAREGSHVPASTLPVTLAYQDDSPGSWLNFIARAMADPATDVAKLEILVRMQRQILSDEARLAFHHAMSATQAEMQPVVRDAENKDTKSRYARLETIDAMLRPIYTRHGFCLSFDTVPLDGPDVRVICEVSHIGRHSKTYTLDACLDVTGPKGTPNKTPIHGLASSISYLRRYLVCMIFHVVLVHEGEDSDGNQPRPRAPAAKPGIATEELYALLAECSADPTAIAANEQAFLRKMGLGDVRSIADARPADLPRLKNALLTKKQVLAAKRDASATGAAA